MAFICPECGASGALEIILSIELPPDSRSDEITVQIVACSRCGFRGAAVYEESRRGSLDSEAWEHSGYKVSEAALTALIEAIRACPEPGNSDCSCASHRSLSRTDGLGRWIGIADGGAAERFALRAGG